MPIDYLAVAAGKNWDLETKHADRLTHAIHGPVVLPGIPGVRTKPVNRPKLDVVCYRARRQIHGLIIRPFVLSAKCCNIWSYLLLNASKRHYLDRIRWRWMTGVPLALWLSN